MGQNLQKDKDNEINLISIETDDTNNNSIIILEKKKKCCFCFNRDIGENIKNADWFQHLLYLSNNVSQETLHA